jgi:hypothetical protein
MENLTRFSPVDEKIETVKRILKISPVKGLAANDLDCLTPEDWLSFADLVLDLELSEQGIRILYNEVYSGGE